MSKASQSNEYSESGEADDNIVRVQQIKHPVFVKPKLERKKRKTPEPESSDDNGVTILRATSTSRLKMKPQQHRESFNDSVEPHYIQYEK